MYKCKLQEYCQSKKWKLPEYSTTKEGLDHCPMFKASVIVNGSTFSTPNFCKSSKEAHNLVAHIAFDHLTDSSSASKAIQGSPTLTDAQQPKKNEPVPLQAVFLSGVDSPTTDDKKFKGAVPTTRCQYGRTGTPWVCLGVHLEIAFKSKYSFEWFERRLDHVIGKNADLKHGEGPCTWHSTNEEKDEVEVESKDQKDPPPKET